MDPAVTVAITQREGFYFTRESLGSLLDSLTAPVPIIYVDGGSPADCRDFLASHSRSHLRHIRTENFLSPNGAKQLAIPHIGTDS